MYYKKILNQTKELYLENKFEKIASENLELLLEFSNLITVNYIKRNVKKSDSKAQKSDSENVIDIEIEPD